MRLEIVHLHAAFCKAAAHYGAAIAEGIRAALRRAVVSAPAVVGVDDALVLAPPPHDDSEMVWPSLAGTVALCAAARAHTDVKLVLIAPSETEVHPLLAREARICVCLSPPAIVARQAILADHSAARGLAPPPSGLAASLHGFAAADIVAVVEEVAASGAMAKGCAWAAAAALVSPSAIAGISFNHRRYFFDPRPLLHLTLTKPLDLPSNAYAIVK